MTAPTFLLIWFGGIGGLMVLHTLHHVIARWCGDWLTRRHQAWPTRRALDISAHMTAATPRRQARPGRPR